MLYIGTYTLSRGSKKLTRVRELHDSFIASGRHVQSYAGGFVLRAT